MLTLPGQLSFLIFKTNIVNLLILQRS